MMTSLSKRAICKMCAIKTTCKQMMKPAHKEHSQKVLEQKGKGTITI
jgi:hypothetical protein